MLGFGSKLNGIEHSFYFSNSTSSVKKIHMHITWLGFEPTIDH